VKSIRVTTLVRAHSSARDDGGASGVEEDKEKGPAEKVGGS